MPVLRARFPLRRGDIDRSQTHSNHRRKLSRPVQRELIKVDNCRWGKAHMRPILHLYFGVAIRGHQLHSFHQWKVLHRSFHSMPIVTVNANLVVDMTEHYAPDMRVAILPDDALCQRGRVT